MNEIISCPNCNTVHIINPEKHRFRPKYCMECRTIIANEKPKTRVLSRFQQLKEIRKEKTRERFAKRLQMQKLGPREIARRMVKVFR